MSLNHRGRSNVILGRDKLLRQGDNDAADGLEARRLYSLYVSKFQALATTLQSPNVLKELNMCVEVQWCCVLLVCV